GNNAGDDGLPDFTAPDQQSSQPQPTATPTVNYVSVVVARVDLPVGQRITPDLLLVERRPATNIAVQAGVTFENIDELVGQIVRVKVSRGQEILRPMLALNTTDLSAFGSD